MRAWRLARRRYASLDGEGARLFGGRWNPPGLAMVYASEHLSLAALEIMVHLELGIDEFPADYVKIAVDIPDSISIRRVAQLPKREEEMRKMGAEWIEAGSTAVMMVPSVVIPEEFNVLLNPAQLEFDAIRAGAAVAFRFDPRLLGA